MAKYNNKVASIPPVPLLPSSPPPLPLNLSGFWPLACGMCLLYYASLLSNTEIARVAIRSKTTRSKMRDHMMSALVELALSKLKFFNNFRAGHLDWMPSSKLPKHQSSKHLHGHGTQPMTATNTTRNHVAACETGVDRSQCGHKSDSNRRLIDRQTIKNVVKNI